VVIAARRVFLRWRPSTRGPVGRLGDRLPPRISDMKKLIVLALLVAIGVIAARRLREA
jgi:hypothetical protein